MADCEVVKIDSNVTGLRYAEEECPNQLPPDADVVWNPLEPNSYSDFGGQTTTTAREPITNSRQRYKGSTTDLDVSGGFDTDMTTTNAKDLLQGFMFADIRTKTSYTTTGAAGDIEVVADAGTFPRLTSTTLDFTTLGLIPGEWIYIGGDAVANRFTLSQNNGFKRVYSVDENELVFDKSVAQMESEDGGSIQLMIYMGQVLKNEADPSLIKKRSYQFERTLGSLDGLNPPQSEYLKGMVANEFSLNLATADKLTMDMSFVGIDFEQRTQAEGLKAGARPQLVSGAFINTSSDIRRVKLSYIDPTTEVPVPMFSFLQEGTLTINNGVTANKAIGALGAIDTSAGDFVVSGDLTAYFSDINAVKAVRNNADVTMDAIMVKGGKAVIFDMPLITLGDGRPNVTKDEPITLPLSLDASTGATVNPALDYTLLWMFFDTLPELASSTI